MEISASSLAQTYDGLLLRPYHKTTPKWAWPGSRDQISKFRDPPYNFGTNRDICFKFGTDIVDGPLLRPIHKKTLKISEIGQGSRPCGATLPKSGNF